MKTQNDEKCLKLRLFHENGHYLTVFYFLFKFNMLQALFNQCVQSTTRKGDGLQHFSAHVHKDLKIIFSQV